VIVAPVRAPLPILIAPPTLILPPICIVIICFPFVYLV